jgi:hypothetical protein
MPIPGTVPINAPLGPTDLRDEYPTHLSKYGRGGLHSVATAAERNAISGLRREAGMLAYVRENRQYYKLENDLVTWSEFSTGGGGGGGSRFVHRQLDPVDHISIPHPLTFVPVCQLQDSTGRLLGGQVIPTDTAIDVSFGVALSFTLTAI